MTRRRAPLVVLIAFALGIGLMIPFEEWFTRLVGVGFLLAAIVGGVFVIAEPRFLSSDDE